MAFGMKQKPNDRGRTASTYVRRRLVWAEEYGLPHTPVRRRESEKEVRFPKEVVNLHINQIIELAESTGRWDLLFIAIQNLTATMQKILGAKRTEIMIKHLKRSPPHRK
jgi:tRNA uridine 5-carbamoylmethylation protein Kti12